MRGDSREGGGDEDSRRSQRHPSRVGYTTTNIYYEDIGDDDDDEDSVRSQPTIDQQLARLLRVTRVRVPVVAYRRPRMQSIRARAGTETIASWRQATAAGHKHSAGPPTAIDIRERQLSTSLFKYIYISSQTEEYKVSYLCVQNT